MTDDFEFDPLERELQRRFDTLDARTGRSRRGPRRDAPRLRRAQRNHRIATSAAASLVVVAAVVLGLAAFRDSDTGKRPGHAACDALAVGVDDDHRTARSGNAAGVEPRRNRRLGPDRERCQPVEPSRNRSRPSSAPTGATSSGSRYPSQTTAPASSDTPYTSPGGSIVVHRSGSTISLGSSTPAAGYTQEVHDNGPTRVEVRFSNGQTEWRIRVDLVNGELRAETTQH